MELVNKTTTNLKFLTKIFLIASLGFLSFTHSTNALSSEEQSEFITMMMQEFNLANCDKFSSALASDLMNNGWNADFADTNLEEMRHTVIEGSKSRGIKIPQEATLMLNFLAGLNEIPKKHFGTKPIKSAALRLCLKTNEQIDKLGYLDRASLTYRCSRDAKAYRDHYIASIKRQGIRDEELNFRLLILDAPIGEYDEDDISKYVWDIVKILLDADNEVTAYSSAMKYCLNSDLLK